MGLVLHRCSTIMDWKEIAWTQPISAPFTACFSPNAFVPEVEFLTLLSPHYPLFLKQGEQPPESAAPFHISNETLMPLTLSYSSRRNSGNEPSPRENFMELHT